MHRYIAKPFDANQVVKKAEVHLTEATKARSYMRGQVTESKAALVETFPDGVPGIASSLPASSTDMSVHFSFDFAQQVCNTNLH